MRDGNAVSQHGPPLRSGPASFILFLSLMFLPRRCRFERALKEGQQFPDWDREMESRLVSFLRQVDREIERGNKRIEEAQGIKSVDLESVPEIVEITKEIDDTMKASEEAGENGDVDESMRLLEKADELKHRKEELLVKNVSRSDTVGSVQPGSAGGGGRGRGNEQFLRVCQTCGGLLSIKDPDERLALHFRGRAHVGVGRCRELLQQVRKRLARGGGGSGGGGGAVGGGRNAQSGGGFASWYPAAPTAAPAGVAWQGPRPGEEQPRTRSRSRSRSRSRERGEPAGRIREPSNRYGDWSRVGAT